MPVRVKHGNYTLHDAPFVWGFEVDEGEGFLRPVVHPKRTSEKSRRIVSAGRLMLSALAEAGWDVPGVEVVLGVHASAAVGPVRYVRSVGGEHGGVPFLIEFDEYGEIEGGGVPGVASRITLGDRTLEHGSDDRRSSILPDALDDLILSAVARARKMPRSPGAAIRDRFGDDDIRRLTRVEKVPAPAGTPTIYVWTDWESRPQSHRNEVLCCSGYRLFSGNARVSDYAEMHPRYFDSFDYGSADVNVKADQGVFSVRGEAVPVEVRLRYANEIYVTDRAVRTRLWNAACDAAEAEGRKEFSRDEQADIETSMAKTMVPLVDYRGGFGDPIYLIGRVLQPGEARFMRGPVKADFDGEHVSITMTDEVTGVVVPFQKAGNAGHGMLARFMREAEDIGRRVDRPVRITPALLTAYAARRAAYEARQAAEENAASLPVPR
jgi:hypothetical protein